MFHSKKGGNYYEETDLNHVYKFSKQLLPNIEFLFIHNLAFTKLQISCTIFTYGTCIDKFTTAKLLYKDYS